VEKYCELRQQEKGKRKKIKIKKVKSKWSADNKNNKKGEFHCP
jgi:hypothetical protein